MRTIEVIFNGHRLNDLFTIVNVSRPLMASPELTTVDVTGRDGAVLTGSRLGSYTVSVTVAALAESAEIMRAAMRVLAGWLAVDGACKLEFSDENGLYRMAAPSEVGDIEALGVVNGQAEITFTICEPWLYGETREVGSSGGAATITVGGTLPAPLCVKSDMVALFGVADESGNAYMISGYDGSLVIDGEAGTVTVDGEAAIMTLDSEWIKLAPGTHTITRKVGSGEFAASITERWAG